MEKLKHVLRQTEFHLLVFLFGFLAVNWPFLGVFQHRSPGIILPYFFFIWTILIIALFLISRGIKARPSQNKEDGQGEGS
jgi:fucose 4-O-acetylase-like acetyltransferase